MDILTDMDIASWLKMNCEVSGNIIIDNELINIDGNIKIISKITRIPVKFGVVTSNFYCYNNQLISLEGAPREVGGSFNCYNNNLTSLVGAPDKVGGGFNCSFNQLTSLVGAPRVVGGGFYCYGNKLTSLEGAPREVGGSFNCLDNKLISLEGLPDIGDDFSCNDYLKDGFEYKWWRIKRFLKSNFKGDYHE